MAIILFLKDKLKKLWYGYLQIIANILNDKLILTLCLIFIFLTFDRACDSIDRNNENIHAERIYQMELDKEYDCLKRMTDDNKVDI